MKKRIAIVGAGPSGIFLAQFLKDFDGEIHLFEQNSDIGEKLKLTGGGRMNILNKRFSYADFSSHHPQLLENFFKNPLSKKLPDLAKSLDMEWIWEKNRAILKSKNAKAEVQRQKIALENQKNCTLHLGCKIENISYHKEEEKFLLHGTQKKWETEIVVLCSGGMFRLQDMGNADKIYALPRNLGHSLTDLSPSLSPLQIPKNPFKNLSGISFVGKIFNEHFSVTDDILLTHFGISGPAVLDFSSFVQENQKNFLSFLPQHSKESWKTQVQNFRKGKISVKKKLLEFVPIRIVDFLLKTAEIVPEKTPFFADLNKEKETKLENTLLAFPLENPKKFPYAACWTTKGGIPLSEIFLATLESKRQKNLFFAGEMLDISGLCGGYNISFALLSAKIVAEAILKK